MKPGPRRTAVVTDSAADLPAEAADELGIAIVPAILVFDGRSYPDGKGLSRQEFYERMPALSRPPTTASPSPEAFSAAYRTAFDSGAERVLSLHVAGSLSGIAAMAQRAAQSFAGRVLVVDSGQVSLGTGFQVLAAARAAADGKSLPEVVADAEAVRRRIRTIAMIDDLEYLRRSGRVGWLRSGIGALLHIRVLIEMVDGVIRRLGQVRGRLRAIDALADRAAAWGPLERLGVLHSAVRDDARGLAARLGGQTADEPLIVEVTTVIGAHVGPRSLGLIGLLAEGPRRATA